jgi:restriction endonuclease S subunit
MTKIAPPFYKLDQLVRITQGIPVSRHKDDERGKFCRVVSPKHLDGMTLGGSIDEVQLNVDLAKHELVKDDILVVLRYNVGKAALITENFSGCVADNNLAVLRCEGSSDEFPKYLVSVLNSQWFYHTQLSAITGGSTVISISLTQLRQLKIPVPDLITQSKLADLFFSLDKLKKSSLSALKIRQEITEESLFQLFGENI